MTTGDFEPQPGQYGQPGPTANRGPMASLTANRRMANPGPTANRAAIPRHPAVRNQAGWACGSWPA